jgi:hypothetical protein
MSSSVDVEGGMSQDRYEEKLDAASSAYRIDPLRDAAHEVVMAWEAEDEQEKNDLSERIWRAIGSLAAVLVSQKRGEPVPQVEVTSSRSPVHVEIPGRPPAARRSGAKNVSDPMYQNAFIGAARAAMGQPSVQDAQALVGYTVTLSFNVDWHPATGVLTEVMDHPAAGAPYLILDNYRERIYPLNSIQEIVKVR